MGKRVLRLVLFNITLCNCVPLLPRLFMDVPLCLTEYRGWGGSLLDIKPLCCVSWKPLWLHETLKPGRA